MVLAGNVCPNCQGFQGQILAGLQDAQKRWTLVWFLGRCVLTKDQRSQWYSREVRYLRASSHM